MHLHAMYGTLKLLPIKAGIFIMEQFNNLRDKDGLVLTVCREVCELS